LSWRDINSHAPPKRQYVCDASPRICGASTQTHGASAHVCGASAQTCGASPRVCRAPAQTCGASPRVCRASTRTCGASAHICGASARICGVSAQTCGVSAQLRHESSQPRGTFHASFPGRIGRIRKTVCWAGLVFSWLFGSRLKGVWATRAGYTRSTTVFPCNSAFSRVKSP
jgi:hypothetical protein